MDYIKVIKEGQVATIMISRPKFLNALNSQVFEELGQAVSEISRDNIRVLVITGEGDKAFVAGADISELSKFEPITARKFLTKAQRVLDKIEQLPIPVVAYINGYALGGGLELALACDIRIAVETAILGLPEVTLGLIPCAGGTQRLTRVAGSSVAKALILTGKHITAAEAKRMGIVTEVVIPENGKNVLDKLVHKLASLAPIALKAAKDSIYAATNVDLASGLELELNYGAMCFTTDDLREGTTAFLEKRKPNFTGK